MFRAPQRLCLLLFVAGVALFAARPTRAVVIDTVNAGTANTTAPADDPGWSSVGTFGVGNATYLGSRWMLTAYHVYSPFSGVSPMSVDFNGTSYPVVPGSGVRLTNADSSPADLCLVQIASDPTVPAVTVSTSRPAWNSNLVMIGAGRQQIDGLVQWDSNWNVVSSGGFYAGFDTTGTRLKRWGTNTIERATSGGPNSDESISLGFGTVSCFFTDFDNLTGDTSQAQVVTYDSGGGAFYKSGPAWQLAGTIIAQGTFTGQPGTTAVYGNTSYMADLSIYAPQIAIIIPEPTSGALALCGLLATVALGIRRRA